MPLKAGESDKVLRSNVRKLSRQTEGMKAVHESSQVKQKDLSRHGIERSGHRLRQVWK